MHRTEYKAGCATCKDVGAILAWNRKYQEMPYAFRCRCGPSAKKKGIPEWDDRLHSKLYARVWFDPKLVRECIATNNLEHPVYKVLKNLYPLEWFKEIKEEVQRGRIDDSSNGTSDSEYDRDHRDA